MFQAQLPTRHAKTNRHFPYMRELRVSDELKFEEYDGRLYLIMSYRPLDQKHRPLAHQDTTIMFTPAQAASLRDFLNGDVAAKAQPLSKEFLQQTEPATLAANRIP